MTLSHPVTHSLRYTADHEWAGQRNLTGRNTNSHHHQKSRNVSVDHVASQQAYGLPIAGKYMCTFRKAQRCECWHSRQSTTGAVVSPLSSSNQMRHNARRRRSRVGYPSLKRETRPSAPRKPQTFARLGGRIQQPFLAGKHPPFLQRPVCCLMLR